MSSSIAEKILQSLNIAVLERIGPHQYRLFGEVPVFYNLMFPVQADGTPCCEPWKHSFMLEFFLDDAELFFERNAPGKFNSGIWQETDICNCNQALYATAIVDGQHQVVIIRLLEDDFTQRARLVQKAREQLLEQRSLHQDLENYKRKSRFDSLTSLLNKESFMEALQRETGRSNALEMDLSLIFIDIDDFKQINDTYGHVVGDKVLASLGKILMESLRSDDVVGRYGGEEFVILAPYATPVQAYHLAEKLRKSVEGFDFEDVPHTVTVSLGCATFIAGESLESFIQRSDLALYDAKRNGKNIVKVR
jgi:diguanylate cyclase (GGDEF) domain